jgi:hypothetical protein
MKNSMLALLLLAFTAIQVPTQGLAEPAEDVKTAMELLKSRTAALGTPSVKGQDTVAGKIVPVLYFGDTAMNNTLPLWTRSNRKSAGPPRSSSRTATSSSAWRPT